MNTHNVTGILFHIDDHQLLKLKTLELAIVQFYCSSTLEFLTSHEITKQKYYTPVSLMVDISMLENHKSYRYWSYEVIEYATYLF